MIKILDKSTAQKMKFSIKDFFSKSDQMENFIFCAVEFIDITRITSNNISDRRSISYKHFHFGNNNIDNFKQKNVRYHKNSYIY